MKFSVISYLDPESTSKIRKIQLELAKITGSTASIEHWMPHITVGDGIEVSETELVELENDLQKVASSTEPFQVQSKGTEAITKRTGGVNEQTSSYAIVLRVEVTNKLNALVAKAHQTVANKRSVWYEMPKPYTPHITLVFRDLTKVGCSTGMDYLRKNHSNLAFNHHLDNISVAEHMTEGDPEYKRFQLSRK